MVSFAAVGSTNPSGALFGAAKDDDASKDEKTAVGRITGTTP